MKRADQTYLKLRYGIEMHMVTFEGVEIVLHTWPSSEFIRQRRNQIYSYSEMGKIIVLNRLYYNRKGIPRREMNNQKVIDRFLKYLMQYDRETNSI